jgi:hypothetical protein
MDINLGACGIIEKNFGKLLQHLLLSLVLLGCGLDKFRSTNVPRRKRDINTHNIAICLGFGMHISQ